MKNNNNNAIIAGPVNYGWLSLDGTNLHFGQNAAVNCLRFNYMQLLSTAANGNEMIKLLGQQVTGLDCGRASVRAGQRATFDWTTARVFRAYFFPFAK